MASHLSSPPSACSAQHLLIIQYHTCSKAAGQTGPLAPRCPQRPHQLLSLSTNLPGVAQSGQAICLRRVYCRTLPGHWAPSAMGSGASGRKPPTRHVPYRLPCSVPSLVCSRSRLDLAYAGPTFTYGAHLAPDCTRRHGLTEMSLQQHRVLPRAAAR
jgi:hypothetical protein